MEVDVSVGWMLSVMAEIVSLRMWSRRQLRYRFLGFLATCILLGGPFYHLGAPIYKSFESSKLVASSINTGIEDQIRQIQQVEDKLKTYLNNSEKRSGWLPPIQNANENLDTLQTELTKLRNRQSAHDPVSRWVITVTVMYALLLTILQINNVVEIRSIVRQWELPNESSKSSKLSQAWSQ